MTRAPMKSTETSQIGTKQRSRPRVLDKYIAEDIKRELWKGTHTQGAVAKMFHTSQATISRIARGEQYPDAPWPDKSIGPMPHARKLLIAQDPSVNADTPGASALTETEKQKLQAALDKTSANTSSAIGNTIKNRRKGKKKA